MGGNMRNILIILFITFLFLNCLAYEWIEIGDFNEPTWKYFNDEENDIQAVGVDEGLYLNINGNWESYFHGYLRVYDIADLNSENLLVTDAGSSNSAGLRKFNLETLEFSRVLWAWYGYKILHCNENYYYIARRYGHSVNGLDWTIYDYWNDDFVYSLAVFENHVIVATENNVYISEDSGITFIPAEPEVPNIADLVYNCNGVLYARTPYDFEESIIYVSYDYGVSWSELFTDTYIGRIGVDSAGRLFVGWRGYPEDYSGIAYWDEQSQELIYLNDNLPNMEINRIQPYEYNGTPSVICCTQEGIYYLTDYVSNNDNEISVESIVKLSNYPNPFNPETTIRYQLPNNGKVELAIYNLKGQKVKQLVSDQLSAGQHSIVWNGKDSNDKRVSSGIYFYKMKTDNHEETKKMILLK